MLHYVALGDSFTWGAAWPRMLASSIEEQLDATVAVHIEGVPGQSARSALDRMRTDTALRGLLVEADIITVNVGVSSLESSLRTHQTGGPCGGADNQDCLRRSFGEVEAAWSQLIQELTALRTPGEATIVTFQHAAWLAEAICGWGNECWEVELGYWLALSDAVAQSAREHGLEVVDLNRVFVGPDYRQRVDDRYTTDGIHLSDEGSAALVDLLVALDSFSGRE